MSNEYLERIFNIVISSFFFLTSLFEFFRFFFFVQDDESLRKWKEQLLGSLDLNSVGGNQPFSSFILIIFRHFGLFWDSSISFYSFYVQIFVCVCEKWPFPVCSGDLFRL